MPADRSRYHSNVYHAFVFGHPATCNGIVVMANSGAGLKLCADFIPQALPADYPAFRWPMVVPQ